MNTTTTRSREHDGFPGTGLNAEQPPDHDTQASSRTPLRSAGRGDQATQAGLAESLATATLLLLCVVARVPHRLLDAAGIFSWVIQLVVVVAVVSGARGLARAPFAFARSSSRPTGDSPRVAAEIKGFLAATIVGATLSLPLYALIRATSFWWLYAAVLFAAVTAVGQLTMPFMLRLQSGPLSPAPPELADRVLAVAAEAGVEAGTVMVAGAADRGGCNAYVAGLGPTRRIVLDGTLASWPPELVDQVVAHEIGHCRLGHAVRRLPLALAAQLGTLALAAFLLSSAPLLDWAGVAHAGDPRSFPLLLLVTPIVALPARCLLAWRDRHQERTADEFALTLLAAPSSFATMLERAASEGGAPRRLSWWRRATASHPPIDERVLACTRFASTS